MTKDRAQTAFPDLARQTQGFLTLNGPAAPLLEQHRRMQETMLKETGTFAQHWFERRLEAARRTAHALHEMNAIGKRDPVAAMLVIADWQRGSFERVNADLLEWITLCTRATHMVAAAQGEVAPSDSDPGKSSKAEGAADSSPGSDHATPV